MKAELGGQRHHPARPQAGILVWELLSCPVAGGGRAPTVSGMQAWRHASCLDLLPAFPEGETELRSAFQIQWLLYEAREATGKQAGEVGRGHRDARTCRLPPPAFVLLVCGLLMCDAPQGPRLRSGRSQSQVGVFQTRGGSGVQKVRPSAQVPPEDAQRAPVVLLGLQRQWESSYRVDCLVVQIKRVHRALPPSHAVPEQDTLF